MTTATGLHILLPGFRIHTWKKVSAGIALRRSINQISVLDFVFDKDDNSVAGYYSLRKENGHQLSDLLNVIFIELPKARDVEDCLEQNTSAENWAIFLKDADNARKQKLIEQLVEKEEGLMCAKESLLKLSADRERWYWQTKLEIQERDRISAYEGAVKKGLKQGIEQGIAQGIEQGIEQGEHKARQENAINLIKMKVLTVEQISEAVGLSLEEVKVLAEKDMNCEAI